MARLLSQTIAAELRVDETATGYSSFTAADGPNYASTAVNDSIGTNTDWSAVSSALVEDGSYANVTLTALGASDYLKLTGWGVALPAGATVNGILVRVTGRPNPASAIYCEARLYKAGTLTGATKTLRASDGDTLWNPVLADRAYSAGSSSDLWGTTWTEAEVEAATFGVGIKATYTADPGAPSAAVFVNFVALTVHYTVAGVETAVTGSAPVRFSPDETDAGNVPQSVGFQTEIPGGFSSADMTVARSELFDPDKLVYASARLYEYETNRTLYEGRVVGISDSGESVTFEMEGWAAHLEDDHSARMIWYDRDLSSWGGISAQRKLNVISSNTIFEGSATADATTGSPAIEMRVEGTGSTTDVYGASYYNARGLPIGFIDYAWRGSSTATNADWAARIRAHTDDINTSSNDSGDVYSSAGPGSGTLTTTGGNKIFGEVLFSTTITTTAGTTYLFYFTLVAVVGTHGLTLQGAVSTPATGRGLYVSDMVEYIVGTWAPLLEIGDIEATDFVVPHAVDKEPTTAREMVEKYALFGGGDLDYPIDWWVYEDRTFGSGTPGNYGKVWRTRYDPDGAEAAESGPDVQRLINGCILTYNNGVDDKTVGPPGSGADFETTDLIDVTPDNPANRTGAQHWELFNAGVTTQGGAVQIGKMIMAERNRQEWRGEVRVKEWVLDDSGHEYPAAMVRAGDRLVIEDDEDTRERRIVQTTYDADSETVSCSIGASPDRLDTLLARLSVVLEGRLS